MTRAAPRVIDDLNTLRGLVGQAVGTSDWLEVSQSAIDAFGHLTGDRQWIHTDPERAKKESPYGTTVAHGFLTLALLSQLHGQLVRFGGGYSRAINYGFNRIRFPAAVPAGSRIRLRSLLAAVEEIPDGVQLAWDVTIEVEGQAKPALAAQWLVRHYR